MSLQTITINQWLGNATALLLQSGSKSARLDAQLLLCEVTKRNRAALLAHENDCLDQKDQNQLQALLKRRINHEPMAYILKHQEFYGRTFKVNSDVLIPRPETETLVDEVIKLAKNSTGTLIDVGTGSGAIAITTKLELPKLNVFATDISKKALDTARQNAKNLGSNIDFYQGNLLDDCTKKYDFIVANLPYVNPQWQRSPETNFEPSTALFAEDNGLKLIKKLLSQSVTYLNAPGYIILEADPCQHEEITLYAKQNGLKLIKIVDYCVVLTNK
jgi:release factor glutamine methyltransferase